MKFYYKKTDVKSKIVCGVNIVEKGETVHRFMGFNTYEELFNELKIKDDNSRCYFEIIKPNCKPYLDIEYEVDKHPEIKPDIINEIVAAILYIFNDVYKLELEK